MQFFPKVFFQQLVSLGMVALVPYNVMTKIVEEDGWGAVMSKTVFFYLDQDQDF